MSKITFLGPVGATFSHDAYDVLAEIYGTPKAIEQSSGRSASKGNCIPAASNGEILGIICGHGGYGTIAMETLAEGRVAEPLESFIELLQKCGSIERCSFRIAGAVRLRLNFCLMVRPGVSRGNIRKIAAHPKALGACAESIARMSMSKRSTGQLVTVHVSSNGEAARLVAENDSHAFSAALGPVSAAKKYGLKILDKAFEDREAVTTFFLIAPFDHRVSVGKKNRMLIVFQLAHTAGALVKSLRPFEREGLNLIQIHSVHAGNHTYDFAVEIDVGQKQLKAAERAMKAFKNQVRRHIFFGPFEVVSK